MFTLLRRVFWLSLIAGAGYAGFTVWQRRSAEITPAASPQWPPLPATRTPTEAPSAVAAVDTPAVESVPASGGWVEPVGGGCPTGYPVKANDNSGIYHVPGGRFYDRTVPERCYATVEGAAADGYRAAKA